MSKSIAALMPPTETERHLKGRIAELERIVRRRKSDVGQINDAMTEILEAVKAAPVPKSKPIIKKGGKVSSPVVHAVHLTDWHVGEFVDPAHVEEFGEANYEVLTKRVNNLGGHIVDQTELMRSAYSVPVCHIIGTADWVSGDIHDELIRTNEFPAPVQAVKAGFLLGDFIVRMSPHFETVEVDLLTAGNHDRLTRKPQSADGGLNSYGYIVCEIARKVASECKNVNIRVHTSLSKVINVGGQRYLIAHGDGIKGTWGIPFYGIERKKQREAMARMNMAPDKHFDRIIIGHFHEALNHQHWMIGGSMSGTTEFDHKEGRHARPHQTSWFIHPEHGEFAWQRWWL